MTNSAWLSLLCILIAGYSSCVADAPRNVVSLARVSLPSPKTGLVVNASHTKLEFPAEHLLGQDSLTAGVLMPRKSAADTVVAKVGGLSIRKSHIYDRLFEDDTLRTKTLVDTIAFDALLAGQATKHKVFVDPEMIDKVVKQEVERLVAQVEKDWQGRMSIDDFLQFKSGRDLKTHRQFMRRQMARDLFRYYVVRFLALRDNRVQVRILTHPDRIEIERIRRMVAEGADFESLALKRSRHPSQKSGGKLPPFSRGDKSQFTDAAFALQEGEVSPIRETTQNGAPMYFLLYCLQHMRGRDITFKAAKPELDKAWMVDPLTRGEANALYLRLRDASEALNNGDKKR